MIRNIDVQRKLAENPPTFKKALSNLNWGQKIVGLLDAGINGRLYEQPFQLLNNFVEQELAEQVAQYNSKQQFGALERNMYAQFYDLSKDEYQAEASVRAVLLKGVSDEIEAFGQLATNTQQIQALQSLNRDIQYKHQIEQAKLNQKAQQDGFDRGIKIMNLQLKQYEAGLGVGGPAGKTGAGLKPKEKIDRRVPFAGEDYYDIPKQTLDKKGGLRDIVQASKSTFLKTPQLEKVAKKVTWKGGFIAPLAIVGVDKAQKAQAQFDTLNKGLTDVMLQSRIKFTGGGNMSNQEQSYLRDFYEVKEGAFVLKDAQKRLKILMGLGIGKYETLFKIIKKDAFFNTLNSMEQSPLFKIQDKVDKYKAVAKELGTSPKDLQDYLKGIDYTKQ